MSFGDFDVNKRPANNNNNRRGVGSSSSSSQPAAFESNIQKGGFGDKVTTGMATATAAKSSTLSAAQNAPDRKYSELWDRCSHSVFVISNNVASIQKSASLFGNKAKDTPEMRLKLQSMQEETRNLIKQTSTDMKELMSVANLEENRPRKLAQEKLQKDFEAVLKRFQSVSKTIAEKSREYVSKAKAQHERDMVMHDEETESRETVPLLSTAQSSQLQAIDNEIDYNEALIEERENDLINIEQSITEVNEIFRDLGTLVHEQGYMLDHIESNVESVAINMENATGELQKANDYQKRARNRMLWIIVFILLVVVIVSAIIFR